MRTVFFSVAVSGVLTFVGLVVPRVLAPPPATVRATDPRGAEGEVDANDANPTGDADSPIAGLWTRYPASRGDGDPVRFYFFKATSPTSGFGLYRYGRIGLNNTNSYTWSIDGGTLELRFKKTGEIARTRYRIEGKQLVLVADPKEPLLDGHVAYTFVPAPVAAAPDLAGELGAKVGGRLWMDKRSFATGGEGFTMYQLRDSGIDGRGVGWHHIGDFDDWSTESLAYRESGDMLELSFAIRGDSARTPMARTKDTMTLAVDPRGYWHVATYRDAGPSFGWLD